MRILTCDQVREAERQAISRPGMSTLVLMQRAGDATAEFCLSDFEFDSVCVVCGKGNNGGDGMVAAEALRQFGKQVSVVILAKDLTGLSADAAAMCSRMQLKPIWIADEPELESDEVGLALRADLILDAIVGTGFKPPLRGLAAKAVALINRAHGAVVAVDLPSGVDADSRTPVRQGTDSTVHASGIATFIAPKPAHVFGDLVFGPIIVSDLGVPPGLDITSAAPQIASAQEVGTSFPPRVQDANKGQFGHVLVIAGSRGKAGAAALAGLAALRTGAGLVTVACAVSIQSTVAGFAPELMTEALPETEEGTISEAASPRLESLVAGKDAVVLGPGLSRNHETAAVIREFAKECTLPLVLDADGLNAFEGRASELKSARGFRVLTPHPGEAARLTGSTTKGIQEDRMATARSIADETGAYVVLKGSHTIVAGIPGEIWINMTGNPAMAKGGSGDVLSGMIGAALARQATSTGLEINALRVAAAVHLHGMAGDIARDTLHENTVLATDLIASLSQVFHDCEQQMEQGVFYLQR